jgi:hypothetical protein
VTVCDSNEMANLLNQQQIVVKVFVTFYKTGNVALVSGNHANVPAQPQIGELTIQQQADSRSGFCRQPAGHARYGGAECRYRQQRQLSGFNREYSR